MQQPLFYASLVTMVGVNLFISVWFYPQLLQWQAGNVVGRIVTTQKVPQGAFFMYKYTGSARNLHFYSQRIVTHLNNLQHAGPGTWLLTMDEGLKDLHQQQRKYTVVHEGGDFHVTALTLPFLNKDTRAQKVKRYVLVRLEN